MKPLSATQKEVYDRMKPNVWYSAYDLQCSIATLKSMTQKGYLKSRGEGLLGSMYSQRTTVEFMRLS